jgi:hypothetical protein
MSKKIFCVGLWKTGTKSIGRALRILGYDAISVFNACDVQVYKKQIWELHDLKTWEAAMNRIKADADRYDAFADTPWHFVYREMYRLYPDATYILSLRKSPERYAESEHKHYYWHGMDEQKIPGKVFFMQRYNWHNKTIRDFFKDKKLHELNIDGDGLWEKLCAATGDAVPKTPFPHLNKINKGERKGGS